MDQQLGLLRQAKESMLVADHAGSDEFDSHRYAFQITFNEIFPRCLRYSFLIFLYSVVETDLTALCKEVRKRRNLPEEPVSRKKTPFERCKSFLSKSCGIDFESVPAWEQLKILEKVRNCIVHADGCVQVSRDKEFLERKVASGIGLTLSDHSVSKGRLYVDQEFCTASSNAAISFFTIVFEQTRFGPENMMFEG
ncbi:MAG: hypothetical protein HY205_01640 [Nitrospirae bacterium]|nr:hypothetical protein [Nitrospirota bacterium]